MLSNVILKSKKKWSSLACANNKNKEGISAERALNINWIFEKWDLYNFITQSISKEESNILKLINNFIKAYF